MPLRYGPSGADMWRAKRILEARRGRAPEARRAFRRGTPGRGSHAVRCFASSIALGSDCGAVSTPPATEELDKLSALQPRSGDVVVARMRCSISLGLPGARQSSRASEPLDFRRGQCLGADEVVRPSLRTAE